MSVKDEVVWGLHMGALHGSAPMAQGFVAIGWPELGDAAALQPSREAFKKKFVEANPDAKPGNVPVSAGQLFRFVHEMKDGDLIVYPSKQDRMVNIGRLSGGYIYDPHASTEYPHRRKVQWLKSLDRASFSQTALYEIGSALTLFRVTSHADEFITALASPIAPKPVDEDANASANIAEQLEESTEDFVLKRLKTAQSAYDFEHFIAHLLQCMGYHARVTKASGDGGVDVIAHRDELGFEPPIIKVQCKQVTSQMGRPDVQKLFGAIETGEKGLFITLGSFSPDARTFEQAKSNLRLIDGRTLVELVYNHYPKFSPKYQSLIPLKRTYTANL